MAGTRWTLPLNPGLKVTRHKIAFSFSLTKGIRYRRATWTEPERRATL